ARRPSYVPRPKTRTSTQSGFVAIGVVTNWTRCLLHPLRSTRSGCPRLRAWFVYVLPADLFQRALRGAKLHLQLPNVGGSGGRSILRTGEPFRIDLDGWGRQRVQVGTTPIAQTPDCVDVLVLGRGT
ncbi:MAG: hypothetical protein OXF93_14105, partial [Acidobacteria bacterium]|nr:hypothetical protein [Acidobacteriota bacterium]